MDAHVPEQNTDTNSSTEEPSAIVSFHVPRPGKFVVTERDNTDGWIATDTTVDLEP